MASPPALRVGPVAARTPARRRPENAGSRDLRAFLRLSLGRTPAGNGQSCHGVAALAQVEGRRHDGHHPVRHPRYADSSTQVADMIGIVSKASLLFVEGRPFSVLTWELNTIAQKRYGVHLKL